MRNSTQRPQVYAQFVNSVDDLLGNGHWLSAMSFNPLSFAMSALTPPPPNLTGDYEGLEYKWKMFTFRPARQ